MDGSATMTGGSVKGGTMVLLPSARPPLAGSAPAEVSDVPVAGGFAELDRWLDGLPDAGYFDGALIWPVAALRDGILDVRLHPERPDLWARLPEPGGLRAAVRVLLDERRERQVSLVPGEPLRWLQIGDGLVLRLGHEKAMLLRTADGVVLRFLGGERYPMQPGANRVGRTPECGINAAARTSLSRSHAVIGLGDGDAVTLEDLGSRNGTAVEVEPARLAGAIVDDLRQRRLGVIVGPADAEGRQVTHPVASLIARIEATVMARLPLEFEDEVERRPTMATLEAVGHAVEMVTRTEGLRLTMAVLLLAPSVHRPTDPVAAALWPEGLGGVRWSDGLFLDVFGALARRPELRPLLLGNFARRADGASTVRFPGAPGAAVVAVTAADLAARRQGLSGPAAHLPDGDLVAGMAYARLMPRLRAASPVQGPDSAGREAREIVELLLGPAVEVASRAADGPAAREALRRSEPGRQLFAIRKAGAGAVYAIGRVGVDAAWIELIMPRGRLQRHRLSFAEFSSRFQAVLSVTVAAEKITPPS